MCRLITANDLCEAFGVSRSFLYRCRAEGLPYYRIGTKLVRYDLKEVEKWLTDKKKLEIACIGK